MFAHFDFDSFQATKSVDQSLDTYTKKTIKEINEYFLDLHGLLQVVEHDLLLSLKNKFKPMIQEVHKAISELENSRLWLNVSIYF